jgi:DNA-binding HxlR family transcriptional regulator
MTRNDTLSVNILEKTAAAQILLYLFFNQQGVNRSELIRNIKAASDTLDTTIKFLELNNLISESKTKSFPPERLFTLTELGLKVAQPLAAIAEALHTAEDSEHKTGS